MNHTLLWFNNDLRVHDNEALIEAASRTNRLLCIYCIDPMWFKPNLYGLHSLGKKRQAFLNESLKALSKELESAGQRLHLAYGKPELIIDEIIKKYKIGRVIRSQHSGFYENHQWQQLRKANPQVRFKSFDTFTLFKREQLTSLGPFPTSFSKFRKLVSSVTIPAPLTVPTTLPPVIPMAVQADAMNRLESYGEPSDFCGGEVEALVHTQTYFRSGNASTYKETRNALSGWDNSCKFSPWLANGSVSARLLVEKLQTYETEHGQNDSTEWILFELLWREYFQWYAKHYDQNLFTFTGISNRKPLTCFYPQRFKRWATGTTEWPLVNACMSELNATGYLSNRGRQIVASCLVNELGLDWRCGASYFEQQLLDYDVASNWGNWQYIAGVGADPRGGRHFNLAKQTQQFDPNHEYINYWLNDNTTTMPIDTVDAADWPVS